MIHYRVILLAQGGEELSSGYLFAADDDSACSSARRLMRSNPAAVAVSVLEGQRLVCSYEQADANGR